MHVLHGTGEATPSKLRDLLEMMTSFCSLCYSVPTTQSVYGLIKQRSIQYLPSSNVRQQASLCLAAADQPPDQRITLPPDQPLILLSCAGEGPAALHTKLMRKKRKKADGTSQ